MTKKDFLEGYEEVMGVRLTWQNFLFSVLAVVAMFVVLAIGCII